MLVRSGKLALLQAALVRASKKLKFIKGLQAGNLMNEILLRYRRLLEVKRRRKSKVFISIPTIVRGLRHYSLAAQQLAKSIRSRTEQFLTLRIFNELVDI